MKPKLVRDRIPQIIKESGKIPIIHSAGPEESKWRTVDKMYEELDEFKADPCIEEAADIFHVFHTMLVAHGMSYDSVVKAAVRKGGTHGRFVEMYVLDGVVDA